MSQQDTKVAFLHIIHPENTQEFSSLNQDTTEPQLRGRDERRAPTTIWDHPWSRFEQMTLLNDLPDPYVSPVKFYKGVNSIFHLYSATWSDLAFFCSVAASDEFVLEVQKVDMWGEEVPDIEDQKTKKSGRQFINRLRTLARKLAGELSPGLFEVYQESDETVMEYYDRCVSLAKDQDFDVYNDKGRDVRILRTCFYNGLREDLRRKLIKIRPECMCVPLQQMLPVLRFIVEQDNKKMEEKMKKPVPVTFSVTTSHGTMLVPGIMEDGNVIVEENKKKGLCYQCGGKGHMKRECTAGWKVKP
ncbi:uncharacterized protein LOC143769605 [Ranitomeya variabilis]|uniref:uncharacterized protein LOC143769605 n=1 Tax=Ranitomeya variabilis TaxID=490064 RepID=UPI0040561BF8